MDRGSQGLCFVVVGMGDEARGQFCPEVLTLIKDFRVFSGGKRHRELVAELLPPEAVWIDVVVPLEEVFERYREYQEPILVFASGDPLFFGYTTTLMREFPGLVRATYPHFNSLQLLCHALVLPYHDMRVCSLVGRPWDSFDVALIQRCPKLGVLSDRKKTPSVIAERMLSYGYDQYVMHIGVRLGGSREEVLTLSLPEVVGREFDVPNCLIIEAQSKLDYAAPLGLKERDFMHLNGRSKMITKMPVRLVSLSLLELHCRKTLWDVGFCTASVSVEAKLQFPHLSVRSFEIRPEGEELIQENSRRFGTPGIVYHIGDFMEVKLDELERPEAVFIGGHGGRMAELIERLTSHIAEGGVIVFNSVLEETLRAFRDAIASVGWHITEEMRLQVDTHNPITIMQAKHKPA